MVDELPVKTLFAQGSRLQPTSLDSWIISEAMMDS